MNGPENSIQEIEKEPEPAVEIPAVEDSFPSGDVFADFSFDGNELEAVEDSWPSWDLNLEALRRELEKENLAELNNFPDFPYFTSVETYIYQQKENNNNNNNSFVDFGSIFTTGEKKEFYDNRLSKRKEESDARKKKKNYKN